MKRFLQILVAITTLTCLLFPVSLRAADKLSDNFLNPPQSAKPWVYWFWLNGNITKTGITDDLEAMKKAGVAGVLIMEVDQGAPQGPADFMGQQWRELFKHVVKEARRLGLEVNMNNDAGWNGSGGPWIKPEQSMQEVVFTETNVTGPLHFEGHLVQPQAVAGFYRDIAVMAFPAVGDYRITDYERKSAAQRRAQPRPGPKELSPEMIIPRERVTDISARMDANGQLRWEVPDGQWTIVRFGHTSTGVENAPAPKTGRGLECDKLSREGIEANFNAMMAVLANDNGIRPGQRNPGLMATHIDSWENGSQNWTAKMRQEFWDRRGYDLVPFLPVLTGRVVGTLDISERFLWDLRQTVSDLVIEYYAGHMRTLAHKHAMKFTVEAYGAPCDSIPYAGRSDEPMGEFWTPSGSIETCKAMASAAHVYGLPVVGAEAFTAGDHERWLEHPALLKSKGDEAFSLGINRFVFHRYAMQPWQVERVPGMTMGPWGQHYERTQTWWDWTGPWHDYLARCQYLLRQGMFVADICYLQAETPPHGPGDHPRQGYDWDECGTEIVLKRMEVRDGRLVLPDGMNYQVLALSGTQAMTPPVLRKLKDLVEAGATIIGPRPLSSPSLRNYPGCDADIKRMADDLWYDCDGVKVQEHKFRKGRVVWGPTPEQALKSAGLPPDFEADQNLRYIHRRVGDTDLYFVANPEPYEVSAGAAFRVFGKTAELWHPETGRIEPVVFVQQKEGRTFVGLKLGPSESVFVVFRSTAKDGNSGKPAAGLAAVKLGDKQLLHALPLPPRIKIRKATYGVPGDPQRTLDVTAEVQAKVSAGQQSFTVTGFRDPAFNVRKTLTVEYEIEGKTGTAKAVDYAAVHLGTDASHIVVNKARYGVLDDASRTRDVRDKLQRLLDAGERRFLVARMAEGDDPAYLVVKTLEVEYTADGKVMKLSGRDPEIIDFGRAQPPPSVPVKIVRDRRDRLQLIAAVPGRYEVVRSSGESVRKDVGALPDPLEVAGTWKVRFTQGRGAPPQADFDRLMSWSDSTDPGVKHYSGEAVCTKVVNVPREFLGRGKGLTLDLGKVEVMAKVKFNGKDLGLLWKEPYRVDISEAARAGENRLEVTVVNLWPNRMIGDEQLPEDSERNPDGTLKKWPDWVLQDKPNPTGRFTFTSWRLWKKGDGLRPSGLIGPVTLRPQVVVALE